MQFYPRKQNIFFALILTLELFVASALSASAELFPGDIPSATEIMQEVEDRYHLDLGAVQNQGEGLNVASNKIPAPEVSLFFSPSDPKEGEKISAKALPIYFSNNEDTLYYTWYLKRKDCNSSECDYDNDGRYDEEDWKIGATRILVQNGYDNSAADYNAASNDGDGYQARFGGDKKVNIPDHCYVHDNNSGVNYELEDGCKHLFPNIGASGDGSFGAGEEDFWNTDPEDPSTANNGNKDEANVVGLGQSTFTWNYVAGDEVGVAVEGTSMIPTKYADSSSMIMWAFPKKDCPPENTGTKSISVGTSPLTGLPYAVSIPTANVDLNDCIEKNLVDPTKGGQATNLDVSVTATPDNPINDETTDKGGDIVMVQASVNNARHNVTDMLFEWKVEASKDTEGFTNGRATDVTVYLRNNGLVGNVKGNALDSVRVKLDVPTSDISPYLTSGIGYLRFKVTVTENFSGTAVRKGNSDVIVRYTSSGKKISAYKAETALVSGVRKATLSGATLICNDDALDRAACRVIKNEIIGLKIDNPPGAGHLSNFYWTVNGTPLTCSKKVSGDCSDTEQTNVNFFPVTGGPGATYTVTVTGSDVDKGNTLTLSRTFGVVTPTVTIEYLDRNIVWPRLLGQYRDITESATECSNGLCNDYSTSMFEAFPGSTLGLRATFVPGFLGSISRREWAVDGEAVTESIPIEDSNGNDIYNISFTADKLVGGIYNIDLAAQVMQSDNTRRALLDIWGISPFDSPEINFSATIQVQLQEPGLVEGPQSGPRRYLAAIVAYVPASVMFTFRILLSAALALFALSLLYTFLEERRVKAFVEGFSGER
ncbi:MAG: hypothetical protein Q8Q10_01100 [bacterium]|nr:hypothetical protein [bacterium]